MSLPHQSPLSTPLEERGLLHLLECFQQSVFRTNLAFVFHPFKFQCH